MEFRVNSADVGNRWCRKLHLLDNGAHLDGMIHNRSVNAPATESGKSFIAPASVASSTSFSQAARSPDTT